MRVIGDWGSWGGALKHTLCTPIQEQAPLPEEFSRDVCELLGLIHCVWSLLFFRV